MAENQERQGGWRIIRNATHRSPRGLTPSTGGVSREKGARERSPASDGEQRWGWKQPPASQESGASRAGVMRGSPEQRRGGGGSRRRPKRTVRAAPAESAGVASRDGGGVAAAGVPRKRCKPRPRKERE